TSSACETVIPHWNAQYGQCVRVGSVASVGREADIEAPRGASHSLDVVSFRRRFVVPVLQLTAGGETAGSDPAKRRRKAASSSVATPSLVALSSFDPGLSPTTR